MSCLKCVPLEGRTVILAASAQPQPLIPEWPWSEATVWLASKSTNAGEVYLGGPPDRPFPGSGGQTTGPVSTVDSEKGYPITVGEKRRLPGSIADLWLAGTEGDVLLWTLFPPEQG